MTDTLAAEFAAHADEALAVANETFDTSVETWPASAVRTASCKPRPCPERNKPMTVVECGM